MKSLMLSKKYMVGDVIIPNQFLCYFLFELRVLNSRDTLFYGLSLLCTSWVVINLADVKSGTYWPNQSHLFTKPFYYIEYDVA